MVTPRTADPSTAAAGRPRPWHGLREFLKEYLIIVVGVLTALGAEQIAESLHWRHQTEQAREELAADQRRSLRWIGLTDADSVCALARLDSLMAVLDKAERDGRLPPLGPVGGPPSAVWGMKSWDAMVSSQVLAHLRRGEAALYAQESATSEALKKWRDEARLDWGVLATMSGPGRTLSAAEAANLRAAMGRARADMISLRRSADALGQQVIDTDLVNRPEVEAWWGAGANLLPRVVGDFCAPLSDKTSVSTGDQSLGATPRPPSQPWSNQDDYQRFPR